MQPGEGEESMPVARQGGVGGAANGEEWQTDPWAGCSPAWEQSPGL